MSDEIVKIQKELLCLQDEGPDDTYRVPFSVFDKTSITVRWKREIQDWVTTNPTFIVRHPDSDVAVLCSIKSPSQKERSYYRDGSLFVIDMYPFSRVRILSSRTQDEIEFVTGGPFVERKPEREVFLSDVFQQKVDLLRELVIRFQFRSVFEGKKQKIELPPHKFSEETVGIFVDTAAERVNDFIDEKPVKELLLAILEEADVEKRLDKTVALYKLCLGNVKEWERDSGVIGEESSRRVKSPQGSLFEVFNEKKDRLPPEVKEIVERELRRLRSTPSDSSERAVAERYVETLLSVPWGIYTKDTTDLNKVGTTLNEDHWGLPDPKDRIIEFLAARQLNPEMKAPILCFVGPPGVGKTSLGESIARALGRKFVRTALGGVNDEAEIRGHRRTYIGALPGRIVKLITKARSLNPVFMIDEVDKVSRGGGVHGDPQNALLEVLDPEQNFYFVDNYLAVGIDLSKALFIITANITDTIHKPLLDRSEVIEFTSYTEDEKVHIAKQFLVPKQLGENGLTGMNIEITDEALRAIVDDYTTEAGVRGLERKIAKIFRRIARKIVETESGSDVFWRIDEGKVREYLGDTLHKRHTMRPLPVGVSPALVVSETGGMLLFIETAYRKDVDHRKIKVTGVKGDAAEHVGRVLEESIDTAWDFLFKEGGLLHGTIDEDVYLRVHVSDGGIPKDGPSAGVPILWALYSLFTNQPVKPYLAATGEITLTLEEIEPVGGIKEKVLAAQRAGAKQVLIPEANRNDIKTIPQEVKEKIEIVPCRSMVEALKIAFPDCEKLRTS